MHHRLLWVCAALVLASACENGPAALRPDGSTGFDAGGGPIGDVTYYGQIRPILVENCTMCHRDGGIAPFALEEYEQVVEVAERVEEATALRIMPPFLADNSGECQTFSNHRGLTDAEIALISAWVAGGTLEGDPTTAAPQPVELPRLGSVDVTLQMPNVYEIQETEPDGGPRNDDYRCFVVDTGLTADTYVTGYEVRPQNEQRTHHVIVYNPTSDTQAQRARDLDMEDGVADDGYPCFGGPRVDAPPLVLWAPGTGAVDFPRGRGIQIAGGRPLIVQVHYNNAVPGSPNTDRTEVDLSTSDSAIMAYIVPLLNTGLSLPPRMEEVTSSRTQSLSFLPIRANIYGIFPHMHTLGRTMRVDLARGECVLRIDRWDFNWQLPYWYDDPVPVDSTDAATITCTYNTMSRDTVTTWGDGTQDEMCLAFVFASL